MKNKYIKITFFLLAVLVTSCNDFLDQNPDRRTQLDSKEKIGKILVSAYSRSSFALLTELSSDNIDDLGDNVDWDNDDYNMFYWQDVNGTDQDTPEYLWGGMYEAIANANAALSAITELEGKEDLSAEKGEALVARAYAHFVLVNVFAKHYNDATSKTDLGITYMEDSEKTLEPTYKRESVAAVYEKIERDLLAGLPLINDKLYQQPKFHFNKKAANAFAARFYLYYGKWDKAEQYATVVLGDNPSAVLKDWADLGSGNYEQYDEVPREYVSSKRIANLMVNDMNSLRSRRFYWNGRRNIRFHHHALPAETETIKVNTFYGAGGTNYHLGIFTAVAPYNNTTFFNIPEFFEYTDPVAGIGFAHTGEVMFTTDETLLVRAEARVMQKKYNEAASDLNLWAKNFCKVSENVTVESINNFYNNMPYYTYDQPTQKKMLHPKFTVEKGTQENLIHAVLQCRRVLTLHEGLRWFDIKRYGIEISRRLLGTNGSVIVEHKDFLKVDDPRRAIQIPQNVIKAGFEPNPR
ncbi:RagB/SusD family nutrient uptake outer membrane protein [Weeksellaceae bacterium TAE3-ERU29]|nr:RagB/SusD family nutrient uptake outer membrane protein [Weeksellaceae bacterium TAE3-ERU29]